jgi:hypothetical protein
MKVAGLVLTVFVGLGAMPIAGAKTIKSHAMVDSAPSFSDLRWSGPVVSDHMNATPGTSAGAGFWNTDRLARVGRPESLSFINLVKHERVSAAAGSAVGPMVDIDAGKPRLAEIRQFDVWLMLLMAAGLVACQLGRKQKSLQHPLGRLPS